MQHIAAMLRGDADPLLEPLKDKKEGKEGKEGKANKAILLAPTRSVCPLQLATVSARPAWEIGVGLRSQGCGRV